jgi:hypothetical protein
MTEVLMAFIHRHARGIEDEIARAEAAIRALPELAADGEPAEAESRRMLRLLQERVEELKRLASPPDSALASRFATPCAAPKGPRTRFVRERKNGG